MDNVWCLSRFEGNVSIGVRATTNIRLVDNIPGMARMNEKLKGLVVCLDETAKANKTEIRHDKK